MWKIPEYSNNDSDSMGPKNNDPKYVQPTNDRVIGLAKALAEIINDCLVKGESIEKRIVLLKSEKTKLQEENIKKTYEFNHYPATYSFSKN